MTEAPSYSVLPIESKTSRTNRLLFANLSPHWEHQYDHGDSQLEHPAVVPPDLFLLFLRFIISQLLDGGACTWIYLVYSPRHTNI